MWGRCGDCPHGFPASCWYKDRWDHRLQKASLIKKAEEVLAEQVKKGEGFLEIVVVGLIKELARLP